ncbi:MAG: hypothetical protein NC250_05960 [Alistipes senegalensis]|nr:hypothetical protein [Bacteroides cellulosilyticus]MCM1352258.1 hypothetical protein [Alistipes senegalensis]
MQQVQWAQTPTLCVGCADMLHGYGSTSNPYSQPMLFVFGQVLDIETALLHKTYKKLKK